MTKTATVSILHPGRVEDVAAQTIEIDENDRTKGRWVERDLYVVLCADGTWTPDE